MASGQLITGGTVSTEENKNEGSITKNIKQLLKLLKILHQLKEVQDRFYYTYNSGDFIFACHGKCNDLVLIKLVLNISPGYLCSLHNILTNCEIIFAAYLLGQ